MGNSESNIHKENRDIQDSLKTLYSNLNRLNQVLKDQKIQQPPTLSANIGGETYRIQFDKGNINDMVITKVLESNNSSINKNQTKTSQTISSQLINNHKKIQQTHMYQNSDIDTHSINYQGQNNVQNNMFPQYLQQPQKEQKQPLGEQNVFKYWSNQKKVEKNQNLPKQMLTDVKEQTLENSNNTSIFTRASPSPQPQKYIPTTTEETQRIYNPISRKYENKQQYQPIFQKRSLSPQIINQKQQQYDQQYQQQHVYPQTTRAQYNHNYSNSNQFSHNNSNQSQQNNNQYQMKKVESILINDDNALNNFCKSSNNSSKKSGIFFHSKMENRQYQQFQNTISNNNVNTTGKKHLQYQPNKISNLTTRNPSVNSSQQQSQINNFQYNKAILSNSNHSQLNSSGSQNNQQVYNQDTQFSQFLDDSKNLNQVNHNDPYNFEQHKNNKNNIIETLQQNIATGLEKLSCKLKFDQINQQQFIGEQSIPLSSQNNISNLMNSSVMNNNSNMQQNNSFFKNSLKNIKQLQIQQKLRFSDTNPLLEDEEDLEIQSGEQIPSDNENKNILNSTIIQNENYGGNSNETIDNIQVDTNMVNQSNTSLFKDHFQKQKQQEQKDQQFYQRSLDLPNNQNNQLNDDNNEIDQQMQQRNIQIKLSFASNNGYVEFSSSFVESQQEIQDQISDNSKSQEQFQKQLEKSFVEENLHNSQRLSQFQKKKQSIFTGFKEFNNFDQTKQSQEQYSYQQCEEEDQNMVDNFDSNSEVNLQSMTQNEFQNHYQPQNKIYDSVGNNNNQYQENQYQDEVYADILQNNLQLQQDEQQNNDDDIEIQEELKSQQDQSQIQDYQQQQENTFEDDSDCDVIMANESNQFQENQISKLNLLQHSQSHFQSSNFQNSIQQQQQQQYKLISQQENDVVKSIPYQNLDNNGIFVLQSNDNKKNNLDLQLKQRKALFIQDFFRFYIRQKQNKIQQNRRETLKKQIQKEIEQKMKQRLQLTISKQKLDIQNQQQDQPINTPRFSDSKYNATNFSQSSQLQQKFYMESSDSQQLQQPQIQQVQSIIECQSQQQQIDQKNGNLNYIQDGHEQTSQNCDISSQNLVDSILMSPNVSVSYSKPVQKVKGILTSVNKNRKSKNSSISISQKKVAFKIEDQQQLQQQQQSEKDKYSSKYNKENIFYNPLSARKMAISPLSSKNSGGNYANFSTYQKQYSATPSYSNSSSKDNSLLGFKPIHLIKTRKSSKNISFLDYKKKVSKHF